MIVDRILQIIEFKGLNKSQFYKQTGLSNGFLDKVKDIGVSKLEYILNTFPEIDPGWLITGNGKMLRSEIISSTKNWEEKYPNRDNDHDLVSVMEAHSDYGRVINKLKFAEGLSITDQGAPFYDLPVSAGRVDELLEASEIPSGFISMPGVSCKAFFPIHGCSFEPIIKAGDIIGIDFIDKWENLDPDCIYLIVTYDQRMMKRLMAHPTDSTKLICISPNYRDFEIDKFTIRYIHKVTFCGRPV